MDHRGQAFAVPGAPRSALMRTAHLLDRCLNATPVAGLVLVTLLITFGGSLGGLSITEKRKARPEGLGSREELLKTKQLNWSTIRGSEGLGGCRLFGGAVRTIVNDS